MFRKIMVLLALVMLGAAVCYQCQKSFFFNRFFIDAPLIIDENQLQSLLVNPPSWIEKQIQNDLLPKYPPPSEEAMHNPSLGLVKITLHGDQMSYVTYHAHGQRLEGVVECFKLFAKTFPTFETTLYISVADCIDFYPNKEEIFTFAKDKNSSIGILIPDFTLFCKGTSSYNFSRRLRPYTLQTNQQIPWEKKLNRLIWRGSNTNLIREKLQMLSSSNIDAALFSKRKLYSQFLTPYQMMQAKYLITLDGISCSFPTLHWQLLSNSCVIKPTSKNIQWYYGALKEDIHFIQVKEDLSDLEQVLQNYSDEDAHAIANNGSAFAHKWLSIEGAFVYLHELLLSRGVVSSN